jgi:hypothetical protein
LMSSKKSRSPSPGCASLNNLSYMRISQVYAWLVLTQWMLPFTLMASAP